MPLSAWKSRTPRTNSLSRGCGGATLAVLEGVMGYYDGLGGDTVTAGSYHLARVTKTPVVLVLRCRGMSALTAAALVRAPPGPAGR